MEIRCPAPLPLGLAFCKDSRIVGLSLFPQIMAFNRTVMGKSSFSPCNR